MRLRWDARFVPLAARVGWVGILYAAVTLLVLQVFLLQWSYRGDDPRFGFEQLLSGTAHKPFAYRVLVPLIVDGLSGVWPSSLQTAIEHVEAHSPNPARKRYSWTKPSPAHYIVYSVLFATLFLCLIVARQLLREQLRETSGPFADTAPAVALLFLPITFMHGGYIYDFPDLVLLFLSFWLLTRGAWPAYYCCFALACANKESSVLLLVYLLAMRWRTLSAAERVTHLVLHGMIGTAILSYQRVRFATNPGSGIENHLKENVRFFLSSEPYLGLQSVYSPLVPMPEPYNAVTLLLVGVLLFRGWQRKPAALRRGFVAMAAVLFPLTLYGGFRDEVRNLAPLFPTFFLLACQGFRCLYDPALRRR